MSKKDEDPVSQCWYKISDGKTEVIPEKAAKHNLKLDSCCECLFSIISKSYQQSHCGSRYCSDCYNTMKSRYYCKVCEKDDPDNMVHEKAKIFPDKALIKDFERMVVQCPDCQTSIKLSELLMHLPECEKGWKLCSYCEEMVNKCSRHLCSEKVHKQKSSYKPKWEVCKSCGSEITSKGHECTINWEYRCPFGCIEHGESLEDHRNKAKLFHLDKCWAVLQECKLTMIKKSDNENEKKKWMNDVVNTVKSKVEYPKAAVLTLISEIRDMKKDMDSERTIYEDLSHHLKNQVVETQYTSFDGTILWKIDNFEQIRKDAMTETQKSIFSPPFYTSRFGYKMCLRLYPYGDSVAKSVAMSLYLVIMKGNFDSLLRWPFRQKVTFILMDQDFKTNMIDAFVPTENMSSFARPRTDMNVPSGSSYFIKLDDFNQQKYLKDDTIFIRCIVDCSDLHE